MQGYQVPNRSKFTRHERETAIRVLMESKHVANWVRAEAQFLGVDLSTPGGESFFKRTARAAAERIVG